MKDLDFDELDRAVNSLLPSGSTQDGEQPAVPSLEDATEPTPFASQPLAARRSSGRFMDVVHPSSDMRTAPVPPRPVSREGAVIAPAPSRVSPDAPLQSIQNTPWSLPDASPVAIEAPNQGAGDWPDPIDFTSSTPDEVQKPLSEPGMDELAPSSQEQLVDDDKDINQIADAINQTLNQDQEAQAPLESPFLMDAKVEKRPLGAFSTQAATLPTDLEQNVAPSLIIEPATLPLVSEDSEPQDEPPIETNTPLPAELQDDLLLIEAGVETAGEPKKDEPITPQKPQVEVPAGPTSITQQYTEQPSTGDQPTGAIFDTEAYQKPLAHPVKKKAGWLMVLWVALLLVGGAGAGAAVYFLVLPK